MSILAVVSKTLRVLRWGSLAIDLDSETIHVAGTGIIVSPGEFSLVALLLRRRNLPLSKEAIGMELWGPDHGRDVRQIDMFVARLRRSLASAGLPNAIVAVAGRGYAVIDEVGERDPSRDVDPRSCGVSLAA